MSNFYCYQGNPYYVVAFIRSKIKFPRDDIMKFISMMFDDSEYMIKYLDYGEVHFKKEEDVGLFLMKFDE